MAKTYGDRWETTGSLGGGGQSDIFRVVDKTEEYEGQFALKRLRDVERLSRFRLEISAVRRLAHPNIIRVVDTSDLQDGGAAPHYLVMPIAESGDANKRIALFSGNTENVLRVGSQIAAALAAAHAAGVIHRDVKPGNILFPNESLSVWLSDFGICKTDEHADTPIGHIMGPRRFSAPEIEAASGNNLSPSVDIYSLGQLIFYLLSGGRTFYRENVFAEEWAPFFQGGERDAQLRILLSRMVAPIGVRTESISEVVDSLKGLEDWANRATASLVSNDIRSRINLIRRAVLEAEATKIEKKTAAEAAAAYQEATINGILQLIVTYLNDTVDAFREAGGEITASTSQGGQPTSLTLNLQVFSCLGSSSLELLKLGDKEPFRLGFWVCRHAAGPQKLPQLRGAGEKDTRKGFYIFPIVQRLRNGIPFSFSTFLAGKIINIGRPHNERLTYAPTATAPGRTDRIFPAISKYGFNLDDWPSNQDEILESLNSFLETFLEVVAK
ncbi:protein kinase [Mesorhizobium sp. M1060]|uniref:serine/threonine protein kinase n=1 Tax=Mesorhizobium sp. M1060 TaxID=2957052 RepID=UPI00333858C0